MIRPPPRSTRTYTPFPYATRCLSHSGGRADHAFRLVPACLGVFPAGAGSRQDARLAPLGLPSGKRQAATAARSALRDCPVEEGGDAVQRDIAGKEGFADRSEEHTSELQSLMRISYAVFCLKKQINTLQLNISRDIQYKE